MNKQLKRLLLSSALLISSQAMASVQVFQVTPAVSSITMAPSASTTLDFTVTNNTAVALKITNLQSFGDLANVQSSVTTDTCTGNTIASGSDCSATLTINSPNATIESSGYVDMKVCIDNGAYCSASRNKTTITVDPTATPPTPSVSGCTGADGACKVFVSTSTMKGDMKVTNNSAIATACDTKDSGIARGNCICTTEAAAAGYDGEWYAWLSDSTTDAKDNIKYSAANTYVRASDAVVISSPGTLLSGTLQGPPSPGSPGGAWTGTTIAGTPTSRFCSDWNTASAGDRGVFGLESEISSFWTDTSPFYGIYPCDTNLKVYCFQG